MPIISITEQPIQGSLQAAYRPIVFMVNAVKADYTPKPPVVYCDIYFDGVYYKSIYKTQYQQLLTNDGMFLYYPTLGIVDNGNGTQTVTFTFTPVPNNPVSLVIYAISNTGTLFGPSASGPNSPRTMTIPTGFYRFIFEYYFSNGSKVVVSNMPCTQWRFDIQDECQEIFEKEIAPNGSSNIESSRKMWQHVTCKFRSSGLDSNGFIVADGTVPIQGTAETLPVSGTGFNSNSFVAINTVLQHLNNQNLETHLGYNKSGNWDADCFPLTHRNNKGYEIAVDNSDYYPIFSKNKVPYCLTLNYKNKGQSSFFQINKCGIGVVIDIVIITDGDNCADNKVYDIKIDNTSLPVSLFPMPIFKRKSVRMLVNGPTVDIDVITGDDLSEGDTTIVSGTYNQNIDNNTAGTGIMSFTNVPISNTIYITYYSSTC